MERYDGPKIERAADTRIVYGVRCAWWDEIHQAGSRDGSVSGLPCCPFCGSVLMEVDSIADWWEAVDKAAEINGNPDHRAVVEGWRGRCDKSTIRMFTNPDPDDDHPDAFSIDLSDGSVVPVTEPPPPRRPPNRAERRAEAKQKRRGRG